MAQDRRLILAGDIGATWSRLALYEASDGRLALRAQETYRSGEHGGLEPIAAAFVARAGLRPDLACFGVPGPVHGGRAEPVNLPWVVDGAPLARQLGATVHLLNDLEAAAWGVPLLGADDLLALNEGAPGARGNAAIISAGTGLGQAGLYWDGAAHRPFATEGGHVDFAPRTRLETELLLHLLARFDRVSYERVLSGPGLRNIHDFLRDTGRGRECDRVVRAAADGGDPAAANAEAALDGSCAGCTQALDLFVSLYGAEAGNLALKLLALGGVYLGGGIAPKIRARLTGPAFMDAFTAKGRFASELRAIPVRVILDPHVALRGAARCAAILAGQR